MLEKRFLFKKLIQLLSHSVFWCIVLLFFTYFFGTDTKNFNNVFAFSLFLMPITIATTYVSIYKLIPEYLVTKRYFLFAVYSLYTLIISAYLIMLSIFFSLIYLSNFKHDQMNPITKNLLFIMTGVYLIVVVVSAFKLLKLNLKNSTKANLLEKKILETQLKLKEQELHYLKMQIHPHFLFNTLNTMYGFALKKADETPEMILKLSNLLDYLLYQADKPFVSLTEEINHIKDYIALEQLRFTDRLSVSFTSKTCLGTPQISPMLFLPFVENSFKHGFIENGTLKIDIAIACEGETIVFHIKNTSHNTTNSKRGIGLENIKKRLELLYKDHYELKITEGNTYFEVTLSLNNKKLEVHG